jgi:hypothetical protein
MGGSIESKQLVVHLILIKHIISAVELINLQGFLDTLFYPLQIMYFQS